MRHLRPLLLLTSVALLALSACSHDSPSPTRAYALGQKAEAGHLVYTAYEGQWLPQIGEGTSARVPQHRFFEIRLSATNTGAADAIVPNATLEDDSGHTYEELSDGNGVPSWLGFVRRAKAGETLLGMILFDVPPQHCTLRVSDESGERGALIDIPLSFSAPPGMPAPDLDKR
jgi:hypothetical protein